VSLIVKEIINTRDGIRNRIVKKDHSVVYNSESEIKSPDAANMVYAGSAVIDGEALAIVVATGKDTYLSAFVPAGALAGNDNSDAYIEELKPKFYRISFICFSLLAILSLLSIVTLKEVSFVSNFLMLFSSVAMLTTELIRMGQSSIFSNTIDKMSKSGASKKQRDTTAYVRGSSTLGILSETTRLALLGRAALFDGVSHVGNVCITAKGDILSRLDTQNPIGNRILICIHTYLKAMRESGAQTSLLLDGIGDTIRVSLTAPPVEEVFAGFDILKAVGVRSKGANLVSCPTCGRTKIDLISLAQRVENALRNTDKNITVAVMGCVVNGPGEAKEADIGIAGGIGEGLIFKKGEILRKVPEEKLFDELMLEINKL